MEDSFLERFVIKYLHLWIYLSSVGDEDGCPHTPRRENLKYLSLVDDRIRFNGNPPIGFNLYDETEFGTDTQTF